MRLDPENIGAYADTLVLQVRGGGRELDYSEASLGIVEELLRASDELLGAENMPEPQRNLVTFYNGCYLGEVMARNLEGTWRFEENWFDSSLIFLRESGGLQVFPFVKVHRRVTQGPGHSLVAFYERVKTRLASGSDER